MSRHLFREVYARKTKFHIYSKKKTLPLHKYQNTYARLMPAYSVTHHVCHIYNISKKESQDVNFIEITYKIYILTHCLTIYHSSCLFTGYNAFLSGPATVISLSFDLHIRPDLNIIFFLRFQILNFFRSVFIAVDITCF